MNSVLFSLKFLVYLGGEYFVVVWFRVYERLGFLYRYESYWRIRDRLGVWVEVENMKIKKDKDRILSNFNL